MYNIYVIQSCRRIPFVIVDHGCERIIHYYINRVRVSSKYVSGIYSHLQFSRAFFFPPVVHTRCQQLYTFFWVLDHATNLFQRPSSKFRTRLMHIRVHAHAMINIRKRTRVLVWRVLMMNRSRAMCTLH